MFWQLTLAYGFQGDASWHQPKDCVQTKYTPSWQQHFLKAVCAFYHTAKDFSVMAQKMWQRTQCADLASKLLRAQSHCASIGGAAASLILVTPTVDQTWPCPLKALTQDIRRCPVLSGTKALVSPIDARMDWHLGNLKARLTPEMTYCHEGMESVVLTFFEYLSICAIFFILFYSRLM